MEKTPSSKVKIRFQDCDPFNHLNNSKYIDYFINCREDQLLEHYDLDIFDLARAQYKGWVVVSNQIKYIRPVVVMETVVIESQVIRFDKKSLLVEMRMWDVSKTELKSILWVHFKSFNIKTGQAEEHSGHINELLGKIHLPVKEESFEDRCFALISSLKKEPDLRT